ncbi:MAG TPA: glycosyltransferase family 2 protein, partial [Thermodesulfobacteriota bacterium]|nr:glycosyltransferase family 2 protein [Thermodesulfobacteriota bacterium]
GGVDGVAQNLPTISIVIPTLNSRKTLRECLDSIAFQDYPGENLEVIISDGGSNDSTIEIAGTVKTEKGLNLRVVPNALKTGEAGKAAGLKAATGEVIAFIDSDNVLPGPDWLRAMVEPFRDAEIVAAEPIEYTARVGDGYITRYCAHLGMNDPLCLFLGNYDRYCAVTGLWTEVPHRAEDRGAYLKVELDKLHLPTMGANGFLIRRSAWDTIPLGDYLFDIDVLYELLDSNPDDNGKPVRFAKVKTGIIHIFSGDMRTFARKQRRRIRDYLFYSRLGVRKYPWKKTSRLKLLKFIFSCLTVVPLLAQSLRGYSKRPDAVWLFHPLACWLTLWEYSRGTIAGVFSAKELTREGWSQ